MATKKQDLQKIHAGSLDHGWSWVVMVATCCSFFVIGGLLFSTGLVQTALLQKFQESRSKTSWAGSLYMSLSNLAGPIGTLLIDRTDCRRAQMVAGVLMAIGFLIAGLASSLEWSILGCGAISGIGSGIAFSVSFIVPGFNFRKKLNIVMGICVGGSGLGMFVISPLMEYVRERYGYQGFFVFLSSLSLQLVVTGALMRPSPLESELKLSRCSESSKRGSTSHMISCCKSLCGLLKFYSGILFNKYVLCLSLSLCLYNGGNYISYLIWPSFCLSKGLKAMQSAVVISITGGVYILGRIITGLIASNKLVDERIVYSGSMLIQSAILFLFQLYSGSFLGHVLSAVLLGLVNGSCWVMLTTLNAKYIGVDNLSAANGIEFIFAGIGPLLVSAISGIMLDANFTYEQLFMMCGGSLLIAAAIGIAPMLCTGGSKPRTMEYCLENSKGLVFNVET